MSVALQGSGLANQPKGQIISKAIYALLTSPKKQMDEFDLFAFLLFTANKSNSSVCFLGEFTARQSAFWFYLAFNRLKSTWPCKLGLTELSTEPIIGYMFSK